MISRSGRGAIAVLIGVLAAAACGGGRTVTETTYAGSGLEADIVAVDLAFDRTTLEVPAGEPFGLLFENREGVPHNVSIVDGRGAVLFQGDVFTGPTMRMYDVPAIAPGTYRFRCEVHPDMVGTLVAG